MAYRQGDSESKCMTPSLNKIPWVFMSPIGMFKIVWSVTWFEARKQVAEEYKLVFNPYEAWNDTTKARTPD